MPKVSPFFPFLSEDAEDVLAPQECVLFKVCVPVGLEAWPGGFMSCSCKTIRTRLLASAVFHHLACTCSSLIISHWLILPQCSILKCKAKQCLLVLTLPHLSVFYLYQSFPRISEAQSSTDSEGDTISCGWKNSGLIFLFPGYT